MSSGGALVTRVRIDHQEVPRVDLSHPDEAATEAALSSAIRRFGFVRLAGHGVDPGAIARAFAAATAFFDLPAPIKGRYWDGRGGQRGYTPYLAERAKDRPEPDLKEFWHTGRELPAGHPLRAVFPENPWPDEHVPGFSAAMLDLFRALERCSDRVLGALAVGLGLPRDTFTETSRDGNHVLRALHYPPVDAALAQAGSVRAAAHEDINLCTLLVNATAPGLEILGRDGRWIPVQGGPDEIVADTGDMLQRVTNGVVPSTTHRVINAEPTAGARMSMPFFVHPRPDAVLSVLAAYRGAGFPPPAPDVTGQAFLEERLREQGLLAT
jgi:isopenicillin N synthase-like dioxygenase